MKNIIMIRFLSILVFSLVTLSGLAQETVFSTTVQQDTADNVKPPTNTIKLFVESSVIIAMTSAEQTMTKPVSGFNAGFGLTYYHRYASMVAYGMELVFKTRKYSMRNDSSKKFPDNTHHQKEFLSLSGFALTIYHRFYFTGKKNKNAHGPLIDIGAYGMWGSFNVYYTRDDNPANSLYKYTSISKYNPKYVYPLDAGGLVRIGWEQISIFANYRLTDLIKPAYRQAPYAFNDLPRLEVGMRLVL